MEITFEHANYLWALMVIPVLTIIYFVSLRFSKTAALKFSNFVTLSKISGGIKETPSVLVLAVRILAIIFVILSVSGITIWYVGEVSDRDYVLAIDASSSMSANDFEPSRLDVAKTAAINFVDDLPPGTSVGILSFSGVSFVDQPLTQDKNVVKEAISKIEMKEVGGTDLGNAIITGTNLLIPSQKARSIVLLTDGRSNVGVSKGTAINYAIDYHVTVNGIGIGSHEKDNNGLNLGVDEEELKDLAETTLGNYFLVNDASEVENAYSEINTDKNIGKNPLDLSFIFLLVFLILLLADWLLGNIFYRIIP